MYFDPNISMQAKGMLGILKEIKSQQDEEWFKAPTKRLISYTGYSGQGVLNILHELERKKVTTVDRSGGVGEENRYKLNK